MTPPCVTNADGSQKSVPPGVAGFHQKQSVSELGLIQLLHCHGDRPADLTPPVIWLMKPSLIGPVMQGAGDERWVACRQAWCVQCSGVIFTLLFHLCNFSIVFLKGPSPFFCIATPVNKLILIWLTWLSQATESLLMQLAYCTIIIWVLQLRKFIKYGILVYSYETKKEKCFPNFVYFTASRIIQIN